MDRGRGDNYASEWNDSHREPLDPWALVARVRETRIGFLEASDALRSPVTMWPAARCGGCRFTVPAQDCAHLIAIITRDGADYVRGVAVVAGEPYSRRYAR